MGNGNFGAAVQTGKVPHVAVLVCTYYADDYLFEQLMSIERQTYPNISIWISDDGGDAQTQSIIEDFRRKCERINDLHVFPGPQNGFAANFLSILNNSKISANYFAFCDQDDVWEADKIAKAVQRLQSLDLECPAVYCSRTSLIDAEGNHIGFSPLFCRAPSFQNALVQSLAGGNTMLLNERARALMCRAGQPTVICHDWWVYLLVTGAGGAVIYDPVPTLQYRQHGKNIIGANDNWMQRLARIRFLLGNRFKHWNEINLKALEEAKSLLTEENRELLDSFVLARSSGLWGRLLGILRSGVYRQTRYGNVSLFIAALLGKI